MVAKKSKPPKPATEQQAAVEPAEESEAPLSKRPSLVPWLLIILFTLSALFWWKEGQHRDWFQEPAKELTSEQTLPTPVSPAQTFEDLKNLPEVTEKVESLAPQTEIVELVEETPPPAEPESDGSLVSRVQTLEEAVKTLEDREPQMDALETIALSDRLDALEAKVEALQTPPADKISQGGDWRPVAWLLSLDRLEEAIHHHAPYREALRDFQALITEEPHLYQMAESLLPYADEGLAKPETLKATFNTALQTALAPSGKPTDSTWDGIKQNLSGLITVRKVGAEHNGNDEESLLARAEALVAEDRGPEAEQLIAALPEDKAEPFALWRAQLKAEQTILGTLRDLRRATRRALERGPITSKEPAN